MMKIICFPGSTFNIPQDKQKPVRLELSDEVVTMTRLEAAQVLRLFRQRIRTMSALVQLAGVR